MIRNQWYAVLESKEVPAKRPIGVTRMGEKLVFYRDTSGKVACMRDLCPHIGAPLSLGKVCEDRLACPFHGFEYDSSGKCQYVPALGRRGDIPKSLKVGVYATFEAHDIIWMYWGEPTGEIGVPKFFDIDKSFSYMGFSEEWNIHYSRMIENQLDVMHLPFIHHNTIGRGGRMVVDGPLVKLENDTLFVWVYNRPDDGTPPRKTEDLPQPTRPPFLVFNFPNMWQNRISEDMRITAMFVPIDEEHSKIYIRSYQRMVRIPVLCEAFNLVSNIGSIIITHQDRRVVSRQVPKKTALKKMGEKLLPGDRAILTYRTHRHQLLVKNGQIED